MHRIFRVKAYEAEHGPHFNEEHARKAVSKMENEDGTRGPHWSVEETTALASQYGINLGSRFNRYDWFVALNMVYSDPIVTKLNSLQSDVDGIKCKLPNTVSVPYPQLSCYNPEIFRAAAMGAYAGDAAFNGVGYNSGCGCGC